MRPNPAERVIRWLDNQPISSLYICSVTRAEIELGLALLPEGQRREDLSRIAAEMFSEFVGRCLGFDEVCAKPYANVVAHRRRIGRPITVEDAQIAAIALRHGLTLATRNQRDFDQIGRLQLFDPWQED